MIHRQVVHRIRQFNYSNVFKLDATYRLILKCIATCKKPPNIDGIEEYVNRSEGLAHKSRSSVRRRIFGSTKSPGLEDMKYIFHEKKEKGYRNEKEFFLSLKGILASYAIGVDLSRINALNVYFRLLSACLNDDKLVEFSKQFIYEQIDFFLLWHEISGITITNLILSQDYYRQFFTNGWIYKTVELPSDDLTKTKRKIIESYAATTEALESLIKKNKFPTIRVKSGNISSKYRPIMEINSVVKFSTRSLVTEWFSFILNPLLYHTGKFDNSIIRENVSIPSKSIREIVDEIHREAIHQKGQLLSTLKLI